MKKMTFRHTLKATITTFGNMVEKIPDSLYSYIARAITTQKVWDLLQLTPTNNRCFGWDRSFCRC